MASIATTNGTSCFYQSAAPIPPFLPLRELHWEFAREPFHASEVIQVTRDRFRFEREGPYTGVGDGRVLNGKGWPQMGRFLLSSLPKWRSVWGRLLRRWNIYVDGPSGGAKWRFGHPIGDGFWVLDANAESDKRWRHGGRCSAWLPRKDSDQGTFLGLIDWVEAHRLEPNLAKKKNIIVAVAVVERS